MQKSQIYEVCLCVVKKTNLKQKFVSVLKIVNEMATQSLAAGNLEFLLLLSYAIEQ